MRRSCLAVLLVLTACAGSTPPATVSPTTITVDQKAGQPASAEAKASRLEIPPHVAAALSAPDRSEADRALDGGRHPAELLAYYRVEPGQQVAELFAGGGYTAEVLARTVGPQGRVYGVNSPMILERFAEKPWAERLQKPVMANVVRLDRPFDDPFPPEVTGLDRVFSILVYHDFVWMGSDRDKMNAAIFRALKPGGIYALVDHSAKAGSGTADVETLHRIEQQVVRTELERAGFVYQGEADFLRNPGDTRDWNDSPRVAAERRGTSDRFVMTFVKP